MVRILSGLAWTWAILYAVALGLFLVGTFGFFGSEPDPLAGVFLVPLGLPWIKAVDLFPEPSWPWLATATPLLNIALLFLVSRLFARRQE